MESPTSSFLDLIKRYELSHRSTKKQVSDAHLETISRSYCEEWKSLPPYLKLETIVASDIDRSAKDERQKRHDFLFEWKEIKGSVATYKQLITALLQIKRRQDAEKVCELLKESICPKPLAASETSNTACAMPPTDTAGGKGTHPHALSPDKFEDLKLQLSIDLQKVIGQYSTYVSFIRETLEEKGVSVKDLRSYLMTMSAFSHTEQKLALVSAHKEQLEAAGDLNTIFDLLVTEYASFLNYDIFWSILEKFQKKCQIPPGQEELKYPDHLNAYIKRHKVSEFIEVNPLLKEYTAATSRELVLKIDIESTSRLAVLTNLKAAVAKVLGLKPATLRLLDIKEGCVAATYLIPTPVAKLVFSERTVLTDEQKKQLQALSALRMECNNCVLFDWTEKTPTSTDPMSHANLRPKYNFIQEPDEDLKCAICSNVAEDPMQHVTCGKLFCKDCLGTHGNEKPCPHCKTEGVIFYPDTRSKNAIQSLGVKCTYMIKGCQWEGTFDTLKHHVSTCSHQEEDTPPVTPSRKSNKPQCYVFIDDSNLWIPGQKASGKKLKDADVDSRFRVDHGKFLNLVQKGRHLYEAILYGSIPPPNDTVWKAVSEKNFTVKVYKKSGSGRVKEIHGSMARDIMTTLLTESKEDVTYVIVTGDRNLNPIIVDVLNKGVPVELWSWEAALAREFRQMANTQHLFTVTCLDAITDQFGFTAFMSNRLKRDIDPAHAIVYRDLPAEENVKFMLANHMHRLLRLFYITCVQSQAKGKKDFIVEFPRSKPDDILKQLQQLQVRFRYHPCSYPEYTMGIREHHQPIATTNRFEVFDPDSDYESLPDETPYVEQLQSAEYEADISDTFDILQWKTEVRRKPGRLSYVKRTRETRCEKGDHCPEASACPHQHTEEELRLFARLPNIKFQYYRTKKCPKIDQHSIPDKRKWCCFAHEAKDSWCLKCLMYGHLTDDCKVKK